MLRTINYRTVPIHIYKYPMQLTTVSLMAYSIVGSTKNCNKCLDSK